jgi:hypothetical protein
MKKTPSNEFSDSRRLVQPRTRNTKPRTVGSGRPLPDVDAALPKTGVQNYPAEPRAAGPNPIPDPPQPRAWHPGEEDPTPTRKAGTVRHIGEGDGR